MSRVAIIKIEKNLDSAVERLFNTLQYNPRKKKILIKPNLAGSFKLNSPFSTSTEVIEALIRYFKKKGFKHITIAEGPPTANSSFYFQIAGYYYLKKKYNISLIDLNEVETEDIKGVKIPRLLKDYEYINVAKLKTHMQTFVTLCIKNQKGLIPLWQKRHFHKKNFFKKNLDENIAQVYDVIKPDLSIIDAITGVEGNGPVMGRVVKGINLLVGGYNALDVDHAGTMIMGFDPNKVEHLRLCSKISCHRVKLNEEILQLIKKYKINFKKPSKLQKMYGINWWYGEETCSGCIGSMFALTNIAKKNIFKHPFKTFKLAIYALFSGLDFLTADARLPDKHGKLIACGDCCKHLTKTKGVLFVNGCPPDPKEIYKKI